MSADVARERTKEMFPKEPAPVAVTAGAAVREPKPTTQQQITTLRTPLQVGYCGLGIDFRVLSAESSNGPCAIAGLSLLRDGEEFRIWAYEAGELANLFAAIGRGDARMVRPRCKRCAGEGRLDDNGEPYRIPAVADEDEVERESDQCPDCEGEGQVWRFEIIPGSPSISARRAAEQAIASALFPPHDAGNEGVA
jgi:hypothetical protein